MSSWNDGPSSDTFFTVVVPTYNRSHLIERTLQSLLDQQWRYYEVVVVDDGSTDNTDEVVRGIGDPRIRYFRKENAERAAARNYGVERANGDYINFFDSDDFALPNHLDAAAKLVRERRQPAWFHLGYAVTSPDGTILKKCDSYRGDTLQPYIPHGNPLSTNGVFLRRDVAALHRFNEDRALSISEDYELWYRLAARYPLFFSNTITSHLIEHGGRSVHEAGAERLVRRIELLVFCLRQDTAIQERFGNELEQTELELRTYLALHLSEHRDQVLRTLMLLCRTAVRDPRTVFRRRFLATVRNLMIRPAGG